MCNDFVVKNPRIPRSHALNCLGCMQIYTRLFKSIAMDKQVLKKNMDIIVNIDLEKKCSYLDMDVPRSIPCNEEHS